MKNFSVLANLLSVSIMAVGCMKIEVQHVPPPPPLPKFDIGFKDILKTCTKPESEQVVSPEARANSIVVNDRIETKDIERVNCQGQVVKREHGPVSNVHKLVTVEPPAAALDGLNFIEVENPRTCVTERGIVSDKEVPKEPQAGIGGFLEWLTLEPRANSKGQVSLPVTDSKSILASFNIADGTNAIQIRYYGKCLEYREPRQPEAGDSENCAKAQLLATKDIVIDLKVDRPDVPGVKTINECSQ